MTNMAYSGFLKEIKKNNNGGGYVMKSNINPALQDLKEFIGTWEMDLSK